MDQVHKETLLRTRVELVKDLDVNDEVCDELLSQDIFTELMIEYIVAEHTRMDKVRRLLDDLSRRGSNAYNGFLVALKKTGYDFLASKIVENEKIVRREIEEKEKEKREKSEERERPMQTASNTVPSSRPLESGNDSAAQSSTIDSQHLNSNSKSSESFRLNLTSDMSAEDLPQQSKSEAPDFNPQPQGEVTVQEMACSPTKSQDDDMIDLNLGTTSNQTDMDVDH